MGNNRSGFVLYLDRWVFFLCGEVFIVLVIIVDGE